MPWVSFMLLTSLIPLHNDLLLDPSSNSVLRHMTCWYGKLPPMHTPNQSSTYHSIHLHRLCAVCVWQDGEGSFSDLCREKRLAFCLLTSEIPSYSHCRNRLDSGLPVECQYGYGETWVSAWSSWIAIWDSLKEQSLPIASDEFISIKWRSALADRFGEK